jgi:hypothetical protein
VTNAVNFWKMPMPDHIWVVVHDDETITAHDHQDGALNAARDDEHPWIEEVTLNRAQEAAGADLSAEPGPDAAPGETDTPTPQTGAHRRTWVAPPSLTINGRWTDA